MSKRIIYIDDEHGPSDFYVEGLSEAGFEVIHLDTLQDALLHLKNVEEGSTQFADLYLIDIMMPPGSLELLDKTNSGLTSGFYLLEELFSVHGRRLSSEPVPRPQVLMITAVSNPEILSQITQRHRVEVLAKIEILPSGLVKKVKNMFSK